MGAVFFYEAASICRKYCIVRIIYCTLNNCYIDFSSTARILLVDHNISQMQQAKYNTDQNTFITGKLYSRETYGIRNESEDFDLPLLSPPLSLA